MMDLFEDVRKTEQKAREDHERRLAALRLMLAAANDLAAMEQTPIFANLKGKLAQMLEARTQELLSVRDDREAAVLQGRCVELRAIVALTTNARQNVDQLIQAIADEEDRWRELEPKLRPQRPS